MKAVAISTALLLFALSGCSDGGSSNPPSLPADDSPSGSDTNGEPDTPGGTTEPTNGDDVPDGTDTSSTDDGTSTPIAGGGISLVDGENCSTEEVNQWVDDSMRDYYLYYDQVPRLNLANYTDPRDLVRDLRVDPPDNISFLAAQAPDQERFDEGVEFGYGYELQRDSDGNLRFAVVIPNGPADNAGIVRGDIFIAVNNVPLTDLTDEQADEFFGVGREIRSPILTVIDANGATRRITVTSAEYRINGELHTQRQRFNESITVGYIGLHGFVGTLSNELDAIMAFLLEEPIDELVLDLRYSDFGRSSVSDKLASQIAGAVTVGQVLRQDLFNDKYQDQNETILFSEQPLALNMSRVIVLTSNQTSNVAEQVILSLEPYIDVVTIGERTAGNPFLSRARENCGKVLRAVEIVNVNSAGESSVGGLPADCLVDDSHRFELGDVREPVYAAALEFIFEGVCNTTAPDATNAGLRSRSAADAILSKLPVDPIMNLRYGESTR